MKPSLFALLVIDLQQAYLPTNDSQSLTKACNHLIDLFRGRPIYTLTTAHRRDQNTWPLTAIDSGEAVPLRGSAEAAHPTGFKAQHCQPLVKSRADAFYKTGLDGKLKSTASEALIVCGVSVHGSIQLTAASAYAANYNLVIASDAIRFTPAEPYRTFANNLHAHYHQPYLSNGDIGELLG